MTEVQRSRVILKIDSLKKEMIGKERELESKRSFHSSAWSEYGSELCAGSMLDEERQIQEEITGLLKNILTLEDCLRSGDVDSMESEKERLKSEIQGIEANIRSLGEEKVKKLESLSLLDFRLRVCGER